MVELSACRNIVANIITARYIAERQRRNSRNHNSRNRCIVVVGGGFQVVEKQAEKTIPVGQVLIVGFAVGKHRVGKIVVLVDNGVNFTTWAFYNVEQLSEGGVRLFLIFYLFYRTLAQ